MTYSKAEILDVTPHQLRGMSDKEIRAMTSRARKLVLQQANRMKKSSGFTNPLVAELVGDSPAKRADSIKGLDRQGLINRLRSYRNDLSSPLLYSKGNKNFIDRTRVGIAKAVGISEGITDTQLSNALRVMSFLQKEYGYLLEGNGITKYKLLENVLVTGIGKPSYQGQVLGPKNYSYSTDEVRDIGQSVYNTLHNDFASDVWGVDDGWSPFFE